MGIRSLHRWASGPCTGQMRCAGGSRTGRPPLVVTQPSHHTGPSFRPCCRSAACACFLGPLQGAMGLCKTPSCVTRYSADAWHELKGTPFREDVS